MKQIGKASWYSDSINADGSRPRPGDMTGAHRTLPLGTFLMVTRLNDKLKRHCVIRINDRGPYVRGVMLDLRPAPAKLLGFGPSYHDQDVGHINVQIEDVHADV